MQADAQEIKTFIFQRLSSHPRFRTIIAVSVDRYPTEFAATVWLGEEPDSEMRQYIYGLETELKNLGVSCSILLKSDRQLPFGGRHDLQTSKGAFSYRFHRLDPTKDEDFVYVFSLYQADRVYRLRISLTGTLSSMLRARNRADEDKIIGVYLNWIREQIDADRARAEVLNEKMFGSKDLRLFAPPE
jgi:hypothetical protein